MILKFLVLFLTPLLSGLAIFLIPKSVRTNYRLLLVFAGSYLFAITVSHILPELYHEYGHLQWIGICVLAGFFLQQVLEYFTSGIEHGHMHTHDHSHHHTSHDDHAHDHHHVHHQVSAYVLLLALCVHALLEGGMLAQSNESNPVYDVNAVLIGIVLHRIPAAFALMTVLSMQLGSVRKALPFLLAFSLAAPTGLLLSSYLSNTNVLTADGLMYLYALICGNFLHISTTIVFESSPAHRFNAKKLAVAILGAAVAVGVEYIM